MKSVQIKNIFSECSDEYKKSRDSNSDVSQKQVDDIIEMFVSKIEDIYWIPSLSISEFIVFLTEQAKIEKRNYENDLILVGLINYIAWKYSISYVLNLNDLKSKYELIEEKYDIHILWIREDNDIVYVKWKSELPKYDWGETYLPTNVRDNYKYYVWWIEWNILNQKREYWCFESAIA